MKIALLRFLLQRLKKPLFIQLAQNIFVHEFLGFPSFGIGPAVAQIVDDNLNAGNLAIGRIGNPWRVALVGAVEQALVLGAHPFGKTLLAESRIVLENVNPFADPLQKAAHEISLGRLKTSGRHHTDGWKRILQVAQVEQYLHANRLGPVDKRAGQHGGVDQAVLQRSEAVAAASGADQGDAFLVHAPVPERGSDDDLIQADDGENADLLAAQVLRRAVAGPGHEAVGVFVKVCADDDDVRTREIRRDMRLRRDDIELNLSAG